MTMKQNKTMRRMTLIDDDSNEKNNVKQYG